MRLPTLLTAASCGLLLSSAAFAGTPDSDLQDQVMFGINRADGRLLRYEFAGQSLETLGTVKDSGGATLTGIEAAAYFPGFDNIYALWNDPSDGKNKLVYVAVRDAAATVVVSDIPGGKFTGAAAVNTADLPFTVFAMQTVTTTATPTDAVLPMNITGGANINPNNSPDNEFSCTKGNGATFTRDDLKNGPIDANGTYYQGAATNVRLKPKGNGNQNGLTVDGQAYALQNGSTYEFEGTMTVRVYNDHVKKGKAMGHWYIQFLSGSVTINGEGQTAEPVATTTARLVKLDQQTGELDIVMTLSGAYHGLASTDGKTFYTMKDADLYKLDTTLGTETNVGTTALSDVTGMNFCEGHLLAYDTAATKVAPLDHSTGGNEATPADVGFGDNGPLLFTPADQDVSHYPVNFD